MKKLHLFVSGFVQGVNFRYYTKEKADELGLTGWVKNLPDGRVEVQALGEKEKLAEFLSWCQRGPDLADVKRVEVGWEEGDMKSRGFEIKY
ncbi:MAG: acylphosphatase [Candidatus Cloacimonetes bacterium]|nr:acylphosphatase [Candidatus Cloacimonadota bacterium]